MKYMKQAAGGRVDKHFPSAFQVLDDAFGPEKWRYKDAGVVGGGASGQTGGGGGGGLGGPCKTGGKRSRQSSHVHTNGTHHDMKQDGTTQGMQALCLSDEDEREEGAPMHAQRPPGREKGPQYVPVNTIYIHTYIYYTHTTHYMILY